MSKSESRRDVNAEAKNAKQKENMRKKRQADKRTRLTSDELSGSADESLHLTARKAHLSNHFQNLQSELVYQNHNVYIELEELQYQDEDIVNSSSTINSIYHWNIVSRWIKYEQTYNTETNTWSKPFVGALIYQNLMRLKNTLQYSTVILNSPSNSVDAIVEEIVHDFIARGRMSRDQKQRFKEIILSQKRDHLTVAGALTRKKTTLNEIFSSRHHNYHNHHISSTSNRYMRNNTYAASLFHENTDNQRVRKTSSFHEHFINRTNSNTENPNEIVSLSTLDLNNKDKDSHHIKFFVPSGTVEDSVEYNLARSASNNKNMRSSSSIANLLRNSIQPNKLSNKSIHVDEVDNIEAFLIMVGVVDFLDKPVMAFVRMSADCIDHLAEFQLKIRFLFLFLGPKKDGVDYLEMGRCMGTLMTKKEFHFSAYNSNNRSELVKSINDFLGKSLCLVLPLGDFDRDLMIPMLDWVKIKMAKKFEQFNGSEKPRKHLRKSITAKRKDLNLILDNFEDKELPLSETETLIELSKSQPFRRTKRPFGALHMEIKQRYSQYMSDIYEGFNLHCFIATVFIFTVCIVPALTFGGILAEKTNNWFGVDEMLIATALNGVIFGLFSGQPIMIIGATGPFLIFEEMLFMVCVQKLCIEFLAVRCWVAIWVLIFTLIMLAAEAVFVIHYVTRFAEEIFAFLIASVFLADALKKVISTFSSNPIYQLDEYCKNHISPKVTSAIGTTIESTNATMSSVSLIDMLNENLNETVVKHLMQNRSIYRQEQQFECQVYNTSQSHHGSSNTYGQPNIALLSVALLLGTCAIALALKKLRRSSFFGSYLRRTLCDVGILIAIVLMASVDALIRYRTGITIQKLNIPGGVLPTKFSLRKSWIVSPFGNNYPVHQTFPLWVPFAAIFPAALLFIILFFEVELTGIMLNAKHRKLRKGNGFNMDLLLSAILMTFNSFFGLPWLCAAPVATLAHWASLTIYSSSHVPGVKPKLVRVIEQRLTNVLVHLAIGLCLLAKFILRMIPVPVLFGIFLYFGIVSLSGTQLFERFKLIFIPFKYCPNVAYARGVHPFKRNAFTIIQLVAVIMLLVFKSFVKLSFIFPIMLVLLVPFRRFVITSLFSDRELEQVN